MRMGKNINDTRRKLTMTLILVRTILDLDDLGPSMWVQQTEVSTQDLDQLKKMSTFIPHE